MEAQLGNTVLVWKHNHINNFRVPEVIPNFFFLMQLHIYYSMENNFYLKTSIWFIVIGDEVKNGMDPLYYIEPYSIFHLSSSGSAFSQMISWLSVECALLVTCARLSAIQELQNMPHCLLMTADVSHSI